MCSALGEGGGEMFIALGVFSALSDVRGGQCIGRTIPGDNQCIGRISVLCNTPIH